MRSKGVVMELTLAEMSAEVLRKPASRRSRRRARLVRFVVCEIAALAAMMICARLAVARQLLDGRYNQLFAILLIVSAGAAALIPVLFYGRPGMSSHRLR